MATPLNSPNVYIEEVNAFPNSVVAVATAVPAFVGYTPRAEYKGQSYLLKPVKISSFDEFLLYFGTPSTTGEPEPEAGQYRPIYLPTLSVQKPGEMAMAGKWYDLPPDPGTIYYLYQSIRLFYENGGADCYVVSVGTIGQPTGQALSAGAPLVNPNVAYADLKAGLDLLALEPEPTMLVIPDALLLKRENYGTLLQDILAQCGALGSRVGILDVYGGASPDPLTYTADIADFRNRVGVDENLKYGVAYYPFLKTTIMPDAGIDFEILGGSKLLSGILPVAGNDALQSLLGQIPSIGTPGGPTALQIENGLLQASPEYRQLHDQVLAKINILPPSGAMAGVYTAVDANRGVWTAPANVALAAVVDSTLLLSNQAQGPLNVDAATGKSINAIRLFPGQGVLVWGARTLDGNSQDWRYVNLRRTVIMIEQSIKLAVRAYAFSPNVASTWSLVSSMLNSFLTSLWTQGALAGATPSSSFNIAVGLGTTMTSDDILNGIMHINVSVAVSHPAEFIVIAISQKLQAS